MPIDFSGFDVPNVLITVFDVDKRSFWVRTQEQTCIDDLRSIPSNIATSFRILPDTYDVTIYSADHLAVAERLSTSWELQGFKVERQIAYPHGGRRSIQSFVLA